MPYIVPQKDMLFTLEHVANLSQVFADLNFDLDAETVAGVLDEAAKLNQDIIAPTNRAGDLQPSYLKEGKVTTSPGFKEAFQAYTQGGWQGLSHPEDVGGQGLPKLLATACSEMLNSSNLSFALCALLTDGAIEALLTAGSDEMKQQYIPRMISGEWTGSMNLTAIVLSQGKGSFADMGLGLLSWNWLPLLPIFFIYMISAVAETNRHPFDVVEGEAEIVAGHMVEYSGMGFAVFFLAEYAAMWLVSILAAIMFLGGWLPPVDALSFIPGWIWLGLKTAAVVSMFIWIRATFPRYRYDQIMRLGWKIFIPVTLVWLVVVGAWLHSPWNIWK